jgi:hypothetical protein
MYCKHIVTMSLSTLSMIADFVAWICIWGGQTHCISFSWSELLYCNQLLRMCTRSFSGIFLNIHGSGRFRKFHCTYQPSIYRYLVLLQGTLLGKLKVLVLLHYDWYSHQNEMHVPQTAM